VSDKVRNIQIFQQILKTISNTRLNKKLKENEKFQTKPFVFKENSRGRSVIRLIG